MKNLFLTLLFTITAANAEVSQITVKRVSQDIYQTSGYQANPNHKYVIVTEYCAESAYVDTPASLVFDTYNRYNNRLIWANGRVCKIKSLYTER